METTSGEIGRVITGTQATQLQLNGRNYIQLLALIPGVSTNYSSSFGLAGGFGTNASGQSANGGRAAANFGQIISASDPRSLQFGLRMDF